MGKPKWKKRKAEVKMWLGLLSMANNESLAHEMPMSDCVNQLLSVCSSGSSFHILRFFITDRSLSLSLFLSISLLLPFTMNFLRSASSLVHNTFHAADTRTHLSMLFILLERHSD